MAEQYVWEVRNPDGGMLGTEFARSVMAPAPRVLAHALPQQVDVQIRDDSGALVARASGLQADANTPMARLTIEGDAVRREQVWPGAADCGLPVILPGGEVGILLTWWNAEDGSEWRWQVEFYNHL